MKNKKGNSHGSITVSVITYNQEQFLEKALESVFAQSRKADEIVVVDNGSVDNTARVVKKYLGKIIYVRNKKNMGAARAFNQGLIAASSDYVILLSADDWFCETILEEEGAILDKYPDIAVVYSQAYTWEDGEVSLRVAEPAGKKTVIGRDEFERLLTQGDFIPLLTAMIRKSVYKELGLMDEKIKFRHDWEFWIKLARFYKFSYLAKPLAYWRLGESYGVSSSDFLKSFKYDFGYILKKHLGRAKSNNLLKVKRNAYQTFYFNLCEEKFYKGEYIEGLKLGVKAIRLKPSMSVFLNVLARLAWNIKRRLKKISP